MEYQKCATFIQQKGDISPKVIGFKWIEHAQVGHTFSPLSLSHSWEDFLNQHDKKWPAFIHPFQKQIAGIQVPQPAQKLPQGTPNGMLLQLLFLILLLNLLKKKAGEKTPLETNVVVCRCFSFGSLGYIFRLHIIFPYQFSGVRKKQTNLWWICHDYQGTFQVQTGFIFRFFFFGCLWKGYDKILQHDLKLLSTRLPDGFSNSWLLMFDTGATNFKVYWITWHSKGVLLTYDTYATLRPDLKNGGPIWWP